MSQIKVAIVPVTPFQQNCTILMCTATNRAAVVDPGGDVPLIRRAIDQIGAKVEKIFLTHGHADHAGGAAELREIFGAPIEGPHVGDKFLLDGLEAASSMFGFACRNVAPDRWLVEGDAVTFGEARLDVRFCPGHTPGSVVLINEPMQFCLVGDVLFEGSIGRTDLPGGDHAALLRSIENKLMTLNDNMTFISGHGPLSTIGAERAHNPFLQRQA
ncbi:MBL fold metallo-hydrolase [uncultured Rhodoblastus sp.]|uniref:MBL fold metallo-hydrolase n=1 Tax=uncultured Rhodoblastus sp. TaxID=543037 RepID=UPI0025D7CD88|nr:MBL fold metallo-hydrolase [uncultured Rhodoblastus sp.]